MTTRAFLVALPLLLVACPPSQKRSLEKARELALAGCCSVSEDVATCSKCELLEGATITKESIHTSCANTCEMAELETKGPRGEARCTYEVGWYNGGWHVKGACAPR